MRRSSWKLLRSLSAFPKPPSRFVLRSLTTSTTPSPLLGQLKPSYFQQIPQIPSRMMSFSTSKDLDSVFDFETSFESESAEESLRDFKAMKDRFWPAELRMVYLKLAISLYRVGANPEQVLYYANTAFDRRTIVRPDVAFGCLTRASEILARLEGNGSERDQLLYELQYAVQWRLALTNSTLLGRKEDALLNLKKALEIKELKSSTEDGEELVEANMAVVRMCVGMARHEEALPYCLKALEIEHGDDAVERRYLVGIYTALEEHEKALEQNRLLQAEWRGSGRSADLLLAEIEGANIEIELGRYDSAMSALDGFLQRTEEDSWFRALVFVSMARGLMEQELFTEAMRCLEASKGILEKKEPSEAVGFDKKTVFTHDPIERQGEPVINALLVCVSRMKPRQECASLIRWIKVEAMCKPECIKVLLDDHVVQSGLPSVKQSIGKKREDALGKLKKGLEIKELMVSGKARSKELGEAYLVIAKMYVGSSNFKEALPCCLKALEIHEGLLGRDSVEVALDRRLLGAIYTGLGEHKKALEQNRLLQKVWRKLGMRSDLLCAEIEAANIQIDLGSYDKAIKTLNGCVEKTEEDSLFRALVSLSLGRALTGQELFPSAERCQQVTLGALNKEKAEISSEAAKVRAAMGRSCFFACDAVEFQEQPVDEDAVEAYIDSLITSVTTRLKEQVLALQKEGVLRFAEDGVIDKALKMHAITTNRMIQS